MRTAQPAGHGTVTTTPPDSPVWTLEFECHGAPFHWTGIATSPGAATCKAIAELSDARPEFNRYKARVISSVQVTA